MNNPRISIITASYNSASTIEECIVSVQKQTYSNVEHIVVDGGSEDGTLEILRRYPSVRFISERDNGLYDALNKGINLASGSYIGTLGADDFLASPDVIGKVAGVCASTNCDCCYGDLQIMNRNGNGTVVRMWKSGQYYTGRCLYGWAPPHLALFIRANLFDKFGLYRSDLKISSDYELMLRFIHRQKLSCTYLPLVLVHMGSGGASTRGIRNQFTQFSEDMKAWRFNNHPFPLLPVVLKKMSKLRQYF